MAIETNIYVHTYKITLNVNADWLNGYKNKTYIYAVYKKHSLDLKIYTD